MTDLQLADADKHKQKEQQKALEVFSAGERVRNGGEERDEDGGVEFVQRRGRCVTSSVDVVPHV
jgi:hypothetical protein